MELNGIVKSLMKHNGWGEYIVPIGAEMNWMSASIHFLFCLIFLIILHSTL